MRKLEVERMPAIIEPHDEFMGAVQQVSVMHLVPNQSSE